MNNTETPIKLSDLINNILDAYEREDAAKASIASLNSIINILALDVRVTTKEQAQLVGGIAFQIEQLVALIHETI